MDTVIINNVSAKEWNKVLNAYVKTDATLRVGMIKWLPDGRYEIHNVEYMFKVTQMVNNRGVKSAKGVLYYEGEEHKLIMRWDRKLRGWWCDMPGDELSDFRLVAWAGGLLFCNPDLLIPSKTPRLYNFKREWYDLLG